MDCFLVNMPNPVFVALNQSSGIEQMQRDEIAMLYQDTKYRFRDFREIHCKGTQVFNNTMTKVNLRIPLC
jgi:hypothetical protein